MIKAAKIGFLGLLGTTALAVDCDFAKMLDRMRADRHDPVESFRLFGPESTYSETRIRKWSELGSYYRDMATIYFGKAVADAVPPDAEVVIAMELERRPSSRGAALDNFTTMVLYLPDPKGGFTVHKAFMDPDEGVQREVFHDDSGPARRRPENK